MDLDDDFKFEHLDFEVMLGFACWVCLCGPGKGLLGNSQRVRTVSPCHAQCHLESRLWMFVGVAAQVLG